MFENNLQVYSAWLILQPIKSSIYLPYIPAHHHDGLTFQNLSVGRELQPSIKTSAAIVICYFILPAVMLSPSAITTLISCGRSSDTFSADSERGGSWGQEKFTWPLLKPKGINVWQVLTGAYQSWEPFKPFLYILTYKVMCWNNATNFSAWGRTWSSTHWWVNWTTTFSPQLGTCTTTQVPASWKGIPTVPRTPIKPTWVFLHHEENNIL